MFEIGTAGIFRTLRSPTLFNIFFLCVFQCVGFMECPLSYQEILDAYTVNRWDTGQHFCIRVTIPDGSVLLKVNLKNEFC